MVRLLLHNLDKDYGQVHALRDFTFSFEPGVYALLGPNGSGKTTLMNILSDNISADNGFVSFASDENQSGEEIGKMGIRYRQRLGYLPQDIALYPAFSVERFMWYMATLKGVGGTVTARERKKKISDEIDSILCAVELAEDKKRRISSLSGGMKQRLGIAQAILGSPSVLLLDEPTAGLDPQQRTNIRDFIYRIASDKIVIISTHILSDVESLAREFLMLRHGVLIDHGSKAELEKRIEGRVWSVCVPSEQMGALAQKGKILQTRETDGTVFLRLTATEKPTEDAIPETPTLEDYYLDTYGSFDAESE